MKKNFFIAICFTLTTTFLFGVVYPLLVTGFAQLISPTKAAGQLIHRGDKLIGSELIGQPFRGPGYFHSRPSAAGTGYDAGASSGSNLAPTNKALIERVKNDVRKLRAENPSAPVPVDLVTTSGSGLDPDISPAAAVFQIPRVARERGISESQLGELVTRHTAGRQFGILGEPRVNVLDLNLDLDKSYPRN